MFGWLYKETQFSHMFHARIQEFSSGGGGGGGPDQSDKKKEFFFFFSEIYHFSRFQRGSNIFQGGSNSLFPIETHITCDFPGGVRTPCPLLWIRTCVNGWLYKEFNMARDKIWPNK